MGITWYWFALWCALSLILWPCLHSLQLDFTFKSLIFTQDTAGSERYEAMSRIYYRGARAAIVCYGKSYRVFPADEAQHVAAWLEVCCCWRLNSVVFCHFCLSDLTDSSSFQRARFWVKELQNCEEVKEPLGETERDE